jgi:23S rRNA (guanosine2251-2'-O)-methyltransferase
VAGDVVYGRHSVREALRGRRRVREVRTSDRGREAPEWLRDAAVPVRPAPRLELDELAGSPDHQGVVALVDPYTYVEVETLLAVERPLIVALDGVTDPQNLGAIARSAECAGATGLVLPRHRAAHVTPAVCRASAGAVEHLRIAVVTNLADWLREVRGPGLWSYGAAANVGLDYTQADLADGAVIVIGAEGKGLRPRVAQACDALVSIPLHGRIESLNAGTAAAVLLFEAARQRRA